MDATMTLQLLTTKLTVPAVRPKLVPRVWLLKRLTEGLHRKLTLISAPAGFGKTTLLSTWVGEDGAHACPRPVAWLSLDVGDNDPVRFLTYLTEALSRLSDFPCPSSDFPDSVASSEDYLTGLINRIGAMPLPAVLVLDDVHLLEAASVFDSLAFLLEYLPSSLHVVLSSRADPPLPIARYRAQGQLTEIRQADLRFTHEEAITFLTQVMGLALTIEDVSALEARTEGWIAGLQMAAVSLQHQDDLSRFVQAFAGSHRYVMDYLMEEVLQRQTPEIQRFLLHTSILELLTASLCDAVYPERYQGHTGAQSILEYLEQSNLFVVPLDDDRSRYRYHRLFADLLRRQLSQRYPDLIPELHLRASTWYEGQGLLPESIEHAVAARAFDRAAALVEQVSDSLLMRSEVSTLRRWLDALPEMTLAQWPGLCACHAWLLLIGGEPLRDVETRVAVMERSECTSGRIQAVRALIALFQGQIASALRYIKTARTTLTEEDGFWYSITQWFWGLLTMSEHEVRREDARPLERLLQPHLNSQNVLLAVMGLCNLGELRIKQGRLREADALFARALAQAADARGEPLPIAGAPMIWLGELARERNDLASAEHSLTQGIELINDWGRIAAFDGYLALARVRYAQGDTTAAHKTLDKAANLAVTFDATEMDDHTVAMYRARIAALEGDCGVVTHWVRSRGLDLLDPDDLRLDETIPLHLRKYELSVFGLALILEGRPREALNLLAPLLNFVAAKGRWRLGIEALALQAVAYSMMGESDQALTCLDHAMARAEPEGYLRLFLELGEPMAKLLYKACRQGRHPAYAGHLLAAFSEPPDSVPRSRLADPLIEPLSERELEVLGAIAEGLTNQEIAQRLYISERTVKWHASNLYGKLQVSNRTEATAKARMLGILSI